MLDPAVDGSLGDRSEFVDGANFQKLSTFHMVLEDWLGDDLVTVHPAFAVTEQLANALMASALTGFVIREMEVTPSDQWEILNPGEVAVPKLKWLDIVGAIPEDFFMDNATASLVVSARGLALLREFNLSRCDIRTYLGDAESQM